MINTTILPTSRPFILIGKKLIDLQEINMGNASVFFELALSLRPLLSSSRIQKEFKLNYT
jgi:hypothetical protein